ncbi:MAG TPA: EAL domain-containing protein [Mycobacterium sp.]|nr:EAL domain-containing protein [Mycobacterium sp.]
MRWGRGRLGRALSPDTGGSRVSLKSYQLRLGLFAFVTAISWVNALAIWGDRAARLGELALQSIVGAGTILCGLIVACRMTGQSRCWRLLVVAGCVAFLAGESMWCWTGAGANAPPLSVVAYFLPPLLGLAAMVVLARSGGGLIGHPDDQLRHSRAVTAMDGVVAAFAFTILVVIAGTGPSLPRSQNSFVVVAFAVTELVVVVAVVITAVIYRADRPYRANYLWLAGGILTVATSDRMIAYFHTVGLEGGDLWGGVGFVVGPLAIAYSLLDLSSESQTAHADEAMDIAQLALPYLGFTGIAGLFAFHLLIGRELNAFLIGATVATVVLVATRQVISLRAQRLVTKQLYEAQQRLAHQVHHDSLTELPNRLLFAQRLEHAMGDGQFVLIYVDIDDFKEVNDQYGHAAGDELLRAVGERLRRCIRITDTLARIGGDEFAILITGDMEQPEVVADRIRLALRDPFAVHGSSVRVRASLGLVRHKAGGPAPTSDDLLRQADIAMYEGKRLGKDTAVIYRPSSVLAADFPAALREAKGGVPAGFRLVYQPVVRLPDSEPVAVEALSRWIAPNGTQIPPETFVIAAEAAGLGAALDGLVLDLACRDVVAANVNLDLHVNIGAARLGNPEFEQQVLRTLARHGMDPSRLVVEITETVPIVDLADAAAQITRLKDVGIKVALDDFGAGYNSLTYLHALPVHIVKLDRSLAMGAEADRALILYRSVIGLCDALGFEVIAEGIESSAQAETVFVAGCRRAQGHLLGEPGPLEGIDSSLRMYR